jgi:hypothetical protein
MERKEGQGRRPGAPKNPENTTPRGQGRGQRESKERHPLPSVWDYLKSELRRSEKPSSGQRAQLRLDEWLRTRKRFEKKAEGRDKLIFQLESTFRLPWYVLPEERLQEFRSLVEQLTDEELTECVRKQEKEIQAFRRGERDQLTFHPSAGDSAIILYDLIENKKQKKKEEQSS